MPRICSICSDKRVSDVNKALAQGKAYRHIASHILKDESRYNAVCRHSNDCLKLDVQQAIDNKTLESRVDVYKELQKNLRFAQQLSDAAYKYLADPDKDEITLDARADDIAIIYLDHTDLTKKGDPKKKRGSLQELLDKLDAHNKQPLTINSKHVDIRSFALDAIKTADSTLDKFAKIDGEYTDNKQNPETIARQQEAIKQTVLAMLDEGVDRDEAVNLVAEAAVEEFVN